MSAADDAALDALAAALAPRVLEKVRALLAAEQDDEDALGVAALAKIGYTPGPDPSAAHRSNPKPERKR